MRKASSTATELPELVPILSRGKHRNPRKGACFMEMASFLAGERWSDHPRCTHPLLASVARLTNDLTSDAERTADALIRTRSVPVYRDSEALDQDSRHFNVSG